MSPSPSTNPSTNGQLPFSSLTDDQFDRLEEVVANVTSSRMDWLRSLLDPGKNVYAECGYPEDGTFIDPAIYQRLYDRESVAARVVELFPDETWRTQPTVFETEDGDEVTEFEKAWDALGRGLNPDSLTGGGKSWHGQEQAGVVWEALRRVDVLSGVGRYGVLLIGLTDGQRDLTQPAKRRKGQKLAYLRAFGEAQASVIEVDTDPSSPRYCRPTKYQLTIEDPATTPTGGGTLTTVEVHWSRVIHVADNLGGSDVFGVPRLQQVLNDVLGLRKVRCAAPEMFWKGAFVGIALKSPPGVRVDRSRMRSEIENWQQGLQRILFSAGLDVQQLAPQIADPTPHVQHLLQGIAVKLGVPLRIFLGSERGELASSQDARTWESRIKARQANHVIPRIVVPFVDRLIALGVLPEPTEPITANVEVEEPDEVLAEAGYRIWWPSPEASTDGEKADVAIKKVTAITEMVGKDGFSVISEMDFWTRIMGYEEEEAEALIEGAEEQVEADLEHREDLIERGLAPDPMAEQQPPTGEGEDSEEGGNSAGENGAEGKGEVASEDQE